MLRPRFKLVLTTVKSARGIHFVNSENIGDQPLVFRERRVINASFVSCDPILLLVFLLRVPNILRWVASVLKSWIELPLNYRRIFSSILRLARVNHLEYSHQTKFTKNFSHSSNTNIDTFWTSCNCFMVSLYFRCISD